MENWQNLKISLSIERCIEEAEQIIKEIIKQTNISFDFKNWSSSIEGQKLLILNKAILNLKELNKELKKGGI